MKPQESQSKKNNLDLDQLLINGLSWQQVDELEKAAKQGNTQAQKKLDDAARTYGYANWSDYNQQIMRDVNGALSDFFKSLEKEFPQDDPIVQMILARARQPEITNDPVLGIVAEIPMRFLMQFAKSRMREPIAVSPVVNGGVSISNSNVTIYGDLVGGDKNTKLDSK